MRVTFTEVGEERYDEMRDILPPAIMTAYGFLVGEPTDHRVCTVHGFTMPTFTPFIVRRGRFYEGTPLTAAEFRRLDVDSAIPR
jgi:hypothetical protein